MLRLIVSRSTVVLERTSRRLETTRALVALAVERGRVGIIAVGETESELAKRLSVTVPPEGVRGVAEKILLAAAKNPEIAEPELRFVHPGEDAWWDEKFKDPYSLRHGDASRAQNSRQIFLVAPLSEESWSPHLLRGVMLYVLWTSAATRGKTWPAFLRPKIQIEVAPEISGLHYAELVDQLRSLWGARRIVLPTGKEVDDPPMTPLRLAHRISRVVWIGALVVMVAVAQAAPGPEPHGIAVIAAVVLALGLMASRVLKARTEAELPRRRSERARSS